VAAYAEIWLRGRWRVVLEGLVGGMRVAGEGFVGLMKLLRPDRAVDAGVRPKSSARLCIFGEPSQLGRPDKLLKVLLPKSFPAAAKAALQGNPYVTD